MLPAPCHLGTPNSPLNRETQGAVGYCGGLVDINREGAIFLRARIPHRGMELDAGLLITHRSDSVGDDCRRVVGRASQRDTQRGYLSTRLPAIPGSATQLSLDLEHQ